jgi:hypothetical protein
MDKGRKPSNSEQWKCCWMYLLYAVRVVSKENRQLFLPRMSCTSYLISICVFFAGDERPEPTAGGRGSSPLSSRTGSLAQFRACTFRGVVKGRYQVRQRDGYLMTLSVLRPYSVKWWDDRWIMNWEGFGRQLSCFPRHMTASIEEAH